MPGLAIGTFKGCSGLSMGFEVFEWAEGGNNEFVHQLPGRLHYPNLLLEAGLTEDDAMQKWFWPTRHRRSSRRSRSSSRARTARTGARGPSPTPARSSGAARRIAAASAGMGEEMLEIAHSGLKMP